MNSIMTRRSMRKYLDKPVEAEKTERILRAAMQAPTGHNAQDFEFVVVTDKEMRFTLSRLGPYSHFAENAPKSIFSATPVLSHLHMRATDPRRYAYVPCIFFVYSCILCIHFNL